MINDVSSRLVDSGVFQKVDKDILHALMIDIQRETIPEDVFVLSLSHQQGPFSLLTVGELCSCIQFILELIYHKFAKNNSPIIVLY